MSDSPSFTDSSRKETIVKSTGVTAAERYLGRLCRRTFLSMWSYPAVYRDQGRFHKKGDGKELCDLLVVFENHIIIFSDKDCAFGSSDNLELEWARWYRKAIQKSAKQVWGAERWIKEFPERIFLDRGCTQPFPISLADPLNATFHRIVVAHDGARRCREILGGSGSLMLDSSITGDEHLQYPFTVGHVDTRKGYVHIFDDTTLDIILTTLDTISDFVAYLEKKERFLGGEIVVTAAGEEELLAVYLKKMNADGEHDFVVDGNYDFVGFEEGFWESFCRNPQRLAQIESDKISYSWDALIEKFSFHAMTGTQYISTGSPLKEQERLFRFLAREPRTSRRILAKSIHEVLHRSIRSESRWNARVNAPTRDGDPYYVFLTLRRLATDSDEEYRQMRAHLLASYCRVVKFKYPDARDIVGIATESGMVDPRSEDMIYLDASNWTSEQQAEAKDLHDRCGILRRTEITMGREREYPVGPTGKVIDTRLSRNSSCRCGSGKRFKRCCGKSYFENSRHRKR